MPEAGNPNTYGEPLKTGQWVVRQKGAEFLIFPTYEPVRGASDTPGLRNVQPSSDAFKGQVWPG